MKDTDKEVCVWVCVLVWVCVCMLIFELMLLMLEGCDKRLHVKLGT